jgi:hypothetical protein
MNDVTNKSDLKLNKRPFRSVSLSGTFRDTAQVHAFFEKARDWHIDRFVLMATDWNRDPKEDFWMGQRVGAIVNWQSYAFGGKTVPSLKDYCNSDEIEAQLSIADAVYQDCLKYGIKFIYTVVLPKFPYNNRDAVRKLCRDYSGLTESMILLLWRICHSSNLCWRRYAAGIPKWQDLRFGLLKGQAPLYTIMTLKICIMLTNG